MAARHVDVNRIDNDTTNRTKTSWKARLNFCSWPLADMTVRVSDVRFRG